MHVTQPFVVRGGGRRGCRGLPRLGVCAVLSGRCLGPYPGPAGSPAVGRTGTREVANRVCWMRDFGHSALLVVRKMGKGLMEWVIPETALRRAEAGGGRTAHCFADVWILLIYRVSRRSAALTTTD